MLPFFKLSEDHEWGAGPYHGSGGPLRVTDIAREVHPLCAKFTEAAQALVLPLTQDFNGAVMEGVGTYQGSNTGATASRCRHVRAER